jgi:dolichol-phosphate mannosyltransferase
MIKTIETLGIREKFRDNYWLKRDPIYKERLHWRAQSFRHLVHLLPGQSILEIGAGRGIFTEQLSKIYPGEISIVSVSFNDQSLNEHFTSAVEYLQLNDLPGSLKEKEFDYIIAMDLLDKRNCSWFLQRVYELLKPGGQIIFYESNPWNVMLKIRRFISKILRNKDPRELLTKTDLYELMSEIGFIRVFAIYNDFVYAPLSPSLVWFLKNVSIMLENIPILRTMAGSILIHGQKPPKKVEKPNISLFKHEELRDKISVVVPCYNEEMNIEPLVSTLNVLYGDYFKEIILVDDNSTDNTSEVIQRLAMENKKIKLIYRTPPNGVGLAIRDGFKKAKGEYILSMDCDFQHLLPDLKEIFDEAVKGYDVVIGSRFSRLSILLNYPFKKILANRGFHVLAQLLFMRRFRDITNNLKLLKKEVVSNLQLSQPGFAVNVETGLLPLVMKYNVKEVPISWINRAPNMGVSSFKLLKVGKAYWSTLFKIWIKNLFGEYRHINQRSTKESFKEFFSREIVKKVFVRSVWLIMTAIALVCIIKFGRNIPLAEDWFFVPQITGVQSDLPSWLWEPNNEHRIPLPKIMLYSSIKILNNDFRAGMYLNLIFLSAISLLMIFTAQKLRHGNSSYNDAFFPIIIMHIGHWPNIVWGWQFSFVLPMVLSSACLIIIVRDEIVTSLLSVKIFVISLVALTLCGANGLIFVPFLIVWIIFMLFLSPHKKELPKKNKIYLIVSAIITIILFCIYFIGLERPSWIPTNPGLRETLKTSAQFIAIAFGPAALKNWRIFSVFLIFLSIITGFWALYKYIKNNTKEKITHVGICLFFIAVVIFTFALGYGRAGTIENGMPYRYALPSVPLLLIIYFIWELHKSKVGRFINTLLFLIALFILPLNIKAGLFWGSWYENGMVKIEKDIKDGIPFSVMSIKHREFLIHWWKPYKLEEAMFLLKDAGIKPFSEDSSSQ